MNRALQAAGRVSIRFAYAESAASWHTPVNTHAVQAYAGHVPTAADVVKMLYEGARLGASYDVQRIERAQKTPPVVKHSPELQAIRAHIATGLSKGRYRDVTELWQSEMCTLFRAPLVCVVQPDKIPSLTWPRQHECSHSGLA